jgi:DHA2 family multidrug resistance protein
MSDEVGSSGRWKPSVNPWLIAATVALAAFMEVLDTSIANVALPHIAGDLGASTDQGTWVLTSYLVSNAIILPVGAWASSVIGRKNFFMLCITIFTAASFLCGIAPTLPILLISRVLQGVGGGGLQPMAQAIMADSFEERKRGQAFALYGLVAVLAPSLGPTIGGWITDNYSWRWIFYQSARRHPRVLSGQPPGPGSALDQSRSCQSQENGLHRPRVAAHGHHGWHADHAR